MRVLTLYQPWASLVAVGAKKIETRSWPTQYRGALAIHAARQFSLERKILAEYQELFRTVLKRAGFRDRLDLPLGRIVAICTLWDCRRTEDISASPWCTWLTEQEIAFGDYSPGRWAWALNEVRRLREPIPCRGAQGL